MGQVSRGLFHVEHLSKNPVASRLNPSSSSPGNPSNTSRPRGRSTYRHVSRRASSTLTARTVTRSMQLPRSGRLWSVSNRAFSTCADWRPRSRIASRRNAAFFDLASTIVSSNRGWHSLIGMAGDPPPDPRSNHRAVSSDNLDAIAIGSIIKRSIVSVESGSSGRAVRLIRTFHRRRSSTHRCSASMTERSGRRSPARSARASTSAPKSGSFTLTTTRYCGLE
jgi:hypothetical protein